jgi:hypothetical protein
VIDCVVAPFDQVFPEALDDVKTTEPPEQNVVDPPAEIVGTVGPGLTVTLSGLDVAEQDPLEILTV